jgi:sarcosine oxidase
MRIVVVGSGVIGLLTAVECVRGGALVDLVDQDTIPGALATSNDTYRVVRALHPDDPALTGAGAKGRAGWATLERRLGARFYLRTGVLTIMPADAITASLALLASAGVAAEALSAGALRERYPQLRPEAGRAAVLEPAAGVVLAGEGLLALAGWLRGQPGVRLHAGHRVIEVSRAGAVRLADGQVLAGDGVVVAAGPWSRDLLPDGAAAGLTLLRQTMLTYLPAAPPSSSTGWAGLPVVIGLGRDRDAWLMPPPAAGTTARLSAASACRAVPAMTGRDAPAPWRDHLVDRFATLLTDFDPGRVTGAADGYYLSDPAGRGPRLAAIGDGRVWAYAACGGMSFKIAPLVARALADRVLRRPPRPTGLDQIDRPRPFATAPAGGPR